jgi:4a-hydroxytetrahydrobiopterin dehydratase
MALLDRTNRHEACEGTVAPLHGAELARGVSALPDWSLQDGALQRRVQFGSFDAAVSFATSLALLAERRNHHPAFLVDKRVVEVRIWTRKQAGITALDFALARAVDELVAVSA